MRRRGTGVALGLALMLSGSVACVLPPPGEELAEIANRPPVIDVRNLTPDPAQFAPTSPELTMGHRCPIEFTASIGDPDGDTLYYRVFVDYFDDPPSHVPAHVQVQLDETTRQTDVQFKPDTSFFTSSGAHTVELFIADRPFSQRAQVPPGRVLTDPDGLVDSFMWSVTINDGADPAPGIECTAVGR